MVQNFKDLVRARAVVALTFLRNLRRVAQVLSEADSAELLGETLAQRRKFNAVVHRAEAVDE